MYYKIEENDELSYEDSEESEESYESFKSFIEEIGDEDID
jgi:hypothetical protein